MSEENFDVFDEEAMDNLVYLSDDEGNETAFEYLDSVEYNGKEYVVLISADEEEDGVVILEVEETPDDEEAENFISVEDDAILDAVYEIFREKNKDYFDFAD